jgi:uncharacterized OsmC-like protein
LPLIDRQHLRGNYEGLAEQLSGDPDQGLRRVSVEARVVQDVTIEATFRQYDREWTLVGDEAVSRGGHEEGPSPLRYFLSSIAICQLGWWAKGSAALGCELQALEVGVRTFLDMRGEHSVGGHPTHPQWLIWDIRVSTDSPSDTVNAMIDWGDERCPLGVLVRKAIPIYERVTHNSALIRDTVPAEFAEWTFVDL